MANQTLDINVEGMSCPHCVRAVTNAVSAVAGVGKVEVSLEKKRATVEFDPSRASLQSITKAIEDEGYSVR